MSKEETIMILQEFLDEMCDDCTKNCKKCKRGHAIIAAMKAVEKVEE